MGRNNNKTQYNAVNQAFKEKIKIASESKLKSAQSLVSIDENSVSAPTAPPNIKLLIFCKIQQEAQV